MGFLLTKPPVVVETQDPDIIRLTEVEAEFTRARVQFNLAYQRFLVFCKTIKTGPFPALVNGSVNVEFPRESTESRILAIDVTRKRQTFHVLMAERASLLQKLGRTK
jgi:hypothetical protein